MSVCSWDWGAIATVLSPIIVAVYLYRKWHDQKQKEFVADEAKEILRIIDSLKLSYYSVTFQYRSYNNKKLFDEEYCKNIFNNHSVLVEDFNNRICFLLNLIYDCSIYEKYEYYETYKTMFEVHHIFNDGTKELENLEKCSNEIEKILEKIKFDLVRYAMYKNKIKYKSA